MKLLLVFLLASLLVPSVAGAQVKDPIASIRQTYTTINRNVRKYRKVKKELSGFSTEGGELIAYFEGEKITKMVATFYGESGKAVEEYYYWEGKLIFVFRKESRYSKPMSGKVIATTANRFYFQNEQLIKWINEKGETVSSDTSEFREKEKEYLDSSTQFSAGARSKDPVIGGV